MKVVFLDRDGTVVKYPLGQRWVEDADKIELFPDTIDALKRLAANNFSIVLITNQEGIARGRITEDEFWNINSEIVTLLESSGITVLRTYMNGEADSPSATEWRKPGPKMLLQAAKELKLDLKNIYMVGDSQSDIDASIRAGCKGGILVRGNASSQTVKSPNAVYLAENLLDAAQYIVTHS